MKNVLDIIAANFPKIVAEYKVTEAFIFNGEFYIASEYEISNETYLAMEAAVNM